jgi:hypothetical protein
MRWRAEAYADNWGEPSQQRYYGQAFYNQRIAPFVAQHGERRGPLKLKPAWPPAREDWDYYRLADRRRALAKGQPLVSGDSLWLEQPPREVHDPIPDDKRALKPRVPTRQLRRLADHFNHGRKAA